MFYQQFQPSAALQPYVQCYYIWEHDQYLQVPLQVNSHPSGLTGLVCNYGDPYWVASPQGNWECVPPCFLTGQFRKNYALRLRGQLGMIGVALWPAAKSLLLSIPAIELTGQRIDFRLLVGDQADFLTEQIVNATSHYQRIGILEQFLLKKLGNMTFQPDVVDCAISRIIGQKGILSIGQLSDDLCISPRQFRRRFTEKIGVTPKLYARIKRFSYISHLSITAFSSWMDITHQGGYYDQAHFIHDFCDFSGKKPSEFVNYNREMAQLLGA